jgi:hypothetical protein
VCVCVRDILPPPPNMPPIPGAALAVVVNNRVTLPPPVMPCCCPMNVFDSPPNITDDNGIPIPDTIDANVPSDRRNMSNAVAKRNCKH